MNDKDKGIYLNMIMILSNLRPNTYTQYLQHLVDGV